MNKETELHILEIYKRINNNIDFIDEKILKKKVNQVLKHNPKKILVISNLEFLYFLKDKNLLNITFYYDKNDVLKKIAKIIGIKKDHIINSKEIIWKNSILHNKNKVQKKNKHKISFLKELFLSNNNMFLSKYELTDLFITQYHDDYIRRKKYYDSLLLNDNHTYRQIYAEIGSYLIYGMSDKYLKGKFLYDFNISEIYSGPIFEKKDNKFKIVNSIYEKMKQKISSKNENRKTKKRKNCKTSFRTTL